ncbi:S-layer homology domain-containing protein [uncultured Dysosmobacter sp.]|uniref:S-layer homology domain-containing protein n=1 Tax=uncultured Dysosmobacter sp. TaxID=2591384 RepID=UPI002625631D|nr:S-layer homology domain-containing protein [uncultured Dysosmobacter sp.]
MKKFLSLVLALVMTMSLVTVSAGAKEFTDNDSITYEEAVAVVSEIGIVDGYKDGKFNPTNVLTRQAAAKIICNMILGPTTAAELHADTAPYKDVPITSEFAGYIAYCQKEGIISGYADGAFRPGNTLTGYAFMKMLLGALGYNAATEGYTGANWSINVAKRALNVGLAKSLEGEFNGIKAVTREEACLYAFNTLKADLVEYETVVSTVINGQQVNVGTSMAKAQTWNNSATRRNNIKADEYIQFAEQYFTKLILDETTDVFGRPAREWTFKSEEIGTYVNYDVMVAEYTDSVSAKEVYDAIGKTAMDKFDLAVAVDGNAKSAIVKEIAKNNKDDLTDTGTGVLTQVFVDEDNKESTVTMINTYLAIADKDYNEKKDEVDFNVYGIKETSTGVFEKFNTKDEASKVTLDKEKMTISGDDFVIEEIEEDDAYLVTVAEGEIQSLTKAEVIEDTEISSFKKGSNVTADGTKYSFAETAEYDAETLSAYTDGDNSINLKDATYDIYLDTYGNLIGLEEVDAVDNYLFITGADAGSSNLATKTTEANAIFLDGTSKVIDVSMTKGDGVEDAAIINKWFTYTVDKNDVYTLNEIKSDDFNDEKDKVGQKAQGEGEVEIDKKHVTLDGNGTLKKVYGNTSSIYLTASLKKVKTDDKNYVVISGVDNVTTGVKNASIKTWTEKEAQKDADSKTTTWEKTSYGVYTLFKDNGYVIAAVVVGEDAASSKNLVYAHKGSIDLESYDKTEDEWTWTRKVVFEGEEITLTEKSDALTELKKMKEGEWYQVKYNAEGNVIDVEAAETALTGNKRITKFSDIETAVNNEDTVLLDVKNIDHELTLKGSTLYDETNEKMGVAVDDETKIVLIQTNNNKKTTVFDSGVKALEDVLEDLNKDKETKEYDYNVSAIIEDGIATVVVVYDNVKDGYTENGKPADSDLMVTVKNGVITVDGAEAEIDVVATAIVDELDALGYTDVKVSVGGTSTTEITGVTATRNSIEYSFKFVNKTKKSNSGH